MIKIIKKKINMSDDSKLKLFLRILRNIIIYDKHKNGLYLSYKLDRITCSVYDLEELIL